MSAISNVITELCEVLTCADITFYPESSDTALATRADAFGTIGIASMLLDEETGGSRNAEITLRVTLLGAENATAAALNTRFEDMLERLAASEINVASVRQTGCAYQNRLGKHTLGCELVLRGALSITAGGDAV